jgi:acyl phosphate:glycerol-3-phosphate acyltransferase
VRSSIFAVAIISYLLGSLPSGFIAGRIAGVDVRRHGSGNIGATNVLRLLGKKYGYAVFFFDALKGFLAVRLAIFFAEHFETTRAYSDWFGILAALVCVLGHAFPVWLKFKGGKGVATSAGTMLGLAPVATIVAVFVWIIVFEVTRYVSVASVTATVALPTAIGILLRLHIMHSSVIFYSAIVLATVVCWRHRSNFARLVRGTEQRFTRR